MRKITPNLWFDDQAEEAAQFYTSRFKGSEVGQIKRYDKAAAETVGRPEGSAMIVPFQLAGQDFVGLNGGPRFKFTPAISFFVTLESEAEVDALWEGLADGGSVLMPLDTYEWSEKYGFVQDKFGVSWQLTLGDIADAEGQTIAPYLMFVNEHHGQADDAMRFYASIFKDAAVGDIMCYGANQPPDQEGTVLHARFTLENQTFMAMDSAQQHDFTFNEAISFIVNCETQEEVDHFWDKLSAHPEAEQCGWLKDKFGVSWQIVPTLMHKLLGDPDPEKSQRVMQAMLRMKKLDIAALERAYAQRYRDKREAHLIGKEALKHSRRNRQCHPPIGEPHAETEAASSNVR